MKRLWTEAFLLSAILLCPAGWAKAQTIKLATVVPEGSPWHEALVDIGHEWKSLSNNRVTLRIYPGGVAGDEPDMLRKMRIGQLHAGAFTTVGLISVVPDIEAMSFPMLTRTNEEMDAAIEALSPMIESQLDAKGYKVLGWSMTGWVHFFSRDPLMSAHDLQEQKLFFWGSDTVYVDLLKSLGFQPIALSVTDLLPALQTGLVEAFAAPPAAALSFQWFGLTKHMSMMRWQPMPNMIVISNKKWNALPAALRPQLERVVRDTCEQLKLSSMLLEKEAIAAMKEHGLNVTETSPEMEETFRSLVQTVALPVFLEKRISKDAYETVNKAVNDHRHQP